MVNSSGLHVGFTEITPSVIRAYVENLNALFPLVLDVSDVKEHEIETHVKDVVTSYTKRFSIFTRNTIHQGPFFGSDNMFYIKLYPEDHKFRFSCGFSNVCLDGRALDSLFSLLREYYTNICFGYPIALINNFCHQYGVPNHQYQADSYGARIATRNAKITLEYLGDDVYFKGNKIATKRDLIPLAALVISVLEDAGHRNHFKNSKLSNSLSMLNFTLFDINSYEKSKLYNKYLDRFTNLVSLKDSELVGLVGDSELDSIFGSNGSKETTKEPNYLVIDNTKVDIEGFTGKIIESLARLAYKLK